MISCWLHEMKLVQAGKFFHAYMFVVPTTSTSRKFLLICSESLIRENGFFLSS